MKHITTKLTEKRFLSRLETLCREKTRFDKGYNDKDCFVIRRNRNKCWISKHYADVGRTDGYGKDCIYFQYKVNEKGYIDLEYRFGALLLLLIPSIVLFVAGMALWLQLVYVVIALGSVQWGGLCIASLFWIIGLGGMLYRSRKARMSLEEHLLRICNIKP